MFIEEHAGAWHAWFVNFMTDAGHDVGLDAKRRCVCARVSVSRVSRSFFLKSNSVVFNIYFVQYFYVLLYHMQRI